jgi:hypothetical protein
MMKQLNFRNVNKWYALAGLAAVAGILAIIAQNPAYGQYGSADSYSPAEKSAALQLIEGSNASQAPNQSSKQPPGLIGKPQDHLAPPETVPPIDAPPTDPHPGEVPPVLPPPTVKPKVPYCPQYNSGYGGTDELYPCDPCVRPLTPDGTGPCLQP